MYQGNGHTKALPIAMMGPWQRFEIVGKCEGLMRGFLNNPEATAERIVDGYCMLDRADDRAISVGSNIVIEVSVFGEASVTEKELVELCAGHKIRRTNFASRSGLDESAGSQATDGGRARLRE